MDLSNQQACRTSRQVGSTQKQHQIIALQYIPGIVVAVALCQAFDTPGAVARESRREGRTAWGK